MIKEMNFHNSKECFDIRFSISPGKAVIFQMFVKHEEYKKNVIVAIKLYNVLLKHKLYTYMNDSLKRFNVLMCFMNHTFLPYIC